MALKLALTDIDSTRRDDGRRRETVGNELRTYLEQFADVLRAPVAILDDFPIEDEFGSIGRRRLLVNASRFPSSVSASPIIVLTMHEDGPNREG